MQNLFSQYFIKTLREEPKEAETISHKLLLRGGYIKKLAAGIYNFLPLGFKVLKKIETIVREEMDKSGAQELLMPALLPRELWNETGRWNIYGAELIRIKDRHNRDFCLGPTHEEIITDLVRTQINSYRDLPIILYQIQAKFRDEIRPRFGLMRAREFLMKDAYSFCKNEDELNEHYNLMFKTYCNIFNRCGLKYRAVESFSGAIGGSVSQEFMVIASTGEEAILYCDSCNYAANIEKAEGKSNYELGIRNYELKKQKLEVSAERLTINDEQDLQEVYTPDKKTVEEITAFLKVPSQQLIKSLVFTSGEKIYLALVCGNKDVNLEKLKSVLEVQDLEIATPEVVRKYTQAEVGFAGPVKIKEISPNIKIIADEEVMNLVNAVTGANKTNYHLINVNPQRDFNPDIIADIKVAQEGDGCIKCNAGKLKQERGIEVGHIFKLGTKYSQAMNATYLDEKGNKNLIIMGCYGIGVSRIIQAAIEQNYDEKGIKWHPAISPFQVIIIVLADFNDKKIQDICLKINNFCEQNNIDFIIDDRDERAGVKFNDADLIGFSWQIIIGKKFLEKNIIEIKNRFNGNKKEINSNNLKEILKEIKGTIVNF